VVGCSHTSTTLLSTGRFPVSRLRKCTM
jgi:hypothetical protein